MEIEDNIIITQEERIMTYEEKLHNVSVIANPISSEKLCKRILKLASKALKVKNHLKYGDSNVRKVLRGSDNNGILVLGGNVFPIDQICHIPAVCEEMDLPYIYVPSKEDLGRAFGKPSCSVIFIKEHESYSELYHKVLNGIKKYPLPL